MAREGYSSRLERINKLTKKRNERNISRGQLAAKTGLTAARIRAIERGEEVSGSEAKAICRALNTLWSEIWVKFEGMIVVRERKATRW